MRIFNTFANMKKAAKYILVVACSLILMSFAVHKFYVGIYQIEYAPKKKMLQITTRIFIDDLNNALEEKYKRKMLLGETNETTEDQVILLKYLNEKIIIKVNGKMVPMEFMSKELEDNVLVCYLRCVNISKISKFEIVNNILYDYVTEQQNIIQTNINGTKKSLLLTVSKNSGQVNF